MKRAAPFPGVVNCGDCGENEPILHTLPGSRRVVCAKCAEKAGFSVIWTISNKHFARIRRELTRKIGHKLPAWQFALLLDIDGQKNYLNSRVLGMEAGVAVPAGVAQRAVELSAMSKRDILFLLEQAEMRVGERSSDQNSFTFY